MTEVSQTEEKGQLSCDILHVWNRKRNDTHELTKQKQVLRLTDGGRDSLGVGDGRVHTAVFKMDLLCSTGTSAQCYVAARMRGEFGGEWIHVCVAEPLCCPPETMTTLLIGYVPMQNKKFKIKQFFFK